MSGIPEDERKEFFNLIDQCKEILMANPQVCGCEIQIGYQEKGRKRLKNVYANLNPRYKKEA